MDALLALPLGDGVESGMQGGFGESDSKRDTYLIPTGSLISKNN